MTQSRPAPTPDALTAAIGRRLGELRKAAGITSHGELGQRMTARGVPWSRVSVEKLENGRRGAITAQELVTLALVLGVPLVWLLADPRSADPVPVAAGANADPWAALLWMIGRRPLDGDGSAEWTRAEKAIDLVTTAAVTMRGIVEAMAAEDIFDVATPGHREDGEADRVMRRGLERLAQRLQHIRDAGYVLPPVPAEVRKRAVELGVDLPRQES